jgi:MOSC domain-containing protein YiiM
MRDLPSVSEVAIELLLASPRSRYEGRPTDGPLPATVDETPDTVEIRAGLGIVGDRFFAKPAHTHASVTVMAMESLEAVYSDLGLAGPVDAAAPRRNILLRGVPVDDLRGVEFSLDSGDGPVHFRANRPATPCAWMDVVIAPGAFRAMRGRGGMRCEPLTSGVLRLGPAVLTLAAALPAATT